MSRSACSLGFLLAALPLAHAQEAHSVRAEAHAAALPAAERWVALFETRGFDLTDYRQAVRSGLRGRAASDLIADLERRAVEDQAEFTAFVEAAGGRILARWWLVNGCLLEIRPERLPELRAHPRVASLQPDHRRKPGILTSTNAKNHATDTVQARNILGKGVTIAVVDSGLDVDMNGTGRPHAVFYPGGDPNNTTGGGLKGSRILANYQIGMFQPDDAIAHGTAAAGIAAGEVWNRSAVADRGHAPEARIVGYCVADDAVGGAYWSTLTSAWQKIAADRLLHGITVANCSYEGYYQIGYSDQQAIDALARDGDMVIVGMAGNGGASSEYGYGATNMLAVGAVEHDNRRVASFSARGPISVQPGALLRHYPDLVANGVNLTLPLADAEGSHRFGTGTSWSAPQVAGAAALYRSLKPQAPATEVLAAILATTEDVAGKNLIAPYNSRDAYGHGYLRVDELAALAGGRGTTLQASLDLATSSRSFPVTVTAGKPYAVAVVWFRQDVAKGVWSDIDLEVQAGGVPIADSKSPLNLSELVRFIAPAGGRVDVVVRLKSLEPGLASQAFSLAATPALPFYAAGGFMAFGQACNGSPAPRFEPGPLPPMIGAQYTVDLSLANPMAAALLLVGVSPDRFAGYSLPADLTPFGLPGCSLYTSIEASLGTLVSTIGTASFRLAVPPYGGLVHQRFFHQVLVVPKSGFAQAVLSGAIGVRIGGQM